MSASLHVRWKLPEILRREGVSVYRLNQELAKKVSRATLYKWGTKRPKSIDPQVLGWVLWGLERITGKRYTLQDLLEVNVPSRMEAEPGAASGPWPVGLDPDLQALIKAAGPPQILPSSGPRPAGSANPPPVRGKLVSDAVVEERNEREKSL
jgi:hypothetical protein